MSKDNPTYHIIQSLVANVLICAAKAVAAFFTGSGAMLAETIHTGADCGNQLLLLLGVKGAQKPADESHPLGYGRSLYFWSFIVALLLFTGGGVFSIYEGIHKLEHPEPVSFIGVGLGILLFSLALEGYSTLSNIKEMRVRAKGMSLWRYLHDTKDSDLVVVFGENAAATLGLLIAMVSLVFSLLTDDPRWDAIGSLSIGVVLVGVAIFLAREVKSLLVGERADPDVEAGIRTLLPKFSEITGLLRVITLQQGPGQVMVLIKFGFREDLSIGQVCDVINRFEASLRIAIPEIKWCFVEPDRPRIS